MQCGSLQEACIALVRGQEAHSVQERCFRYEDLGERTLTILGSISTSSFASAIRVLDIS